MFKAPDAQPPATAGGSLDAAETGRAAARCGRPGWEGAGSAAGRAGGRGGGGSGPPRSAPFPLSPSSSLLLFFLCFFFFFSPRPAALSLCEHHQCINARPPNLCPPIPAQNLRTPCGETSGATTLDSGCPEAGEQRDWEGRAGAGRPALPGAWVRGGEEGSEIDDQLHRRTVRERDFETIRDERER